MFVDEIRVDITNNLKEMIFLDYLTLRSILLLNKIIQQKCENIKSRCWIIIIIIGYVLNNFITHMTTS